MIPYARQSIDEEDIAAVVAVLRSDFLTQGPAVERFERSLAERTGARHAVVVSSGTAALHLAALALRLGPGKRLWTSANTFVASANCARYCGAGVGLVDIDPETLNISLADLEARLVEAERKGALPDIVVPVDFAGLPCDYDALGDLARRFHFLILEDAAHSLGGRYHGHPVGHIPGVAATALSFHPVKVITSGEGGAVLTDLDEVARLVRQLRHHGITRDPQWMVRPADGGWAYDQVGLGYNYRMSDLHAALGHAQLGKLDRFLARRRDLAARYDALLAQLPVRLPPRVPGLDSAWHLYPIRLAAAIDRRAVFEHMRNDGIEVNVHYHPVGQQTYYRTYGIVPDAFPEAEHYYRSALTLPLYPGLDEAAQDRVVASLSHALEGA